VTFGPSQVARLTVKARPTIVIPPTGLTNAVGSSFTLTVTATGSVPMGFEWRRGAVKLTNFVLMTTTSSYTVNNAQTADSGLYRVVLTNSGNMNPQTNATATVLIQAPPVITNAPVDQAVEPGSAATFRLGASGSSLFYQWQFGGANITGATNAALTLTNVNTANQGVYQVVATNYAGAVAASASLTLNGPTILLQNVERLPDGSVRMQLSGATNRSYAIDASSHLTNWTTLNTIFYTNGWMPFIDTTSGGVTNRFYRARLVP